MRLDSVNSKVKNKLCKEKPKSISIYAINFFYFFFCLCIIMSSGAERLPKERKITAERYFKNKTHIVCA